MGELAERLSLLVVEARSPDGGVAASARGRGDVRVWFAPDAYRGFAPAELARQLEALAALLWTRYRRRYLEIVAEWADRDEPPVKSEMDREFESRLAELRVAGASPRGWLRVRSRALVTWQVEINGEPVGSLTEREFLAELDGAISALLADHRARVTLLTDAVYDIGLPRAMRAAG